MNHAVIMAGFGGQGILMIGNVLSIGALREGLNVTFFPSYGVEMRGGTANCTVTISNREVGSPVTSRPHGLIAMNEPSVAKFGPRILAGGFLLLNSSMGGESFERGDITILRLPCNEEARDLGDGRLASMVALGAYAALTGILPVDRLESVLPEVLPQKAHKLIPLNAQALRRGEVLARGGA